jgi:hypothetical protein
VIDIIIGDVFDVVARLRATAVVTLRCRTLSLRPVSPGLAPAAAAASPPEPLAMPLPEDGSLG